ncbi:MAG: ATP-grasp domain-containing protein [Patescibacteria group bacterium]
MLNQKIRVGVLRGGVGLKYDMSLQTGEVVLSTLSTDKYKTFDVLITKNRQWYFDGFPTTPAQIIDNIDVVFNALHGEYGEDGKVQQIFEMFKIPYTGSTIVPSAISLDKGLAKYFFNFHNIKTPKSKIIKRTSNISTEIYILLDTLQSPYVVKPLYGGGGSSVGVVVARNFYELLHAVKNITQTNQDVLIEEYIQGRKITCAIVDSLEKPKSFLLPLLEVTTPDNDKIFNYGVKHEGRTTHTSPANIEKNIAEEIRQIAIDTYKIIGLRHYSTANFIVYPLGIYLLEFKSLPGFSKFSAMSKILQASNLELGEFFDHIITCAMDKQ